ncbi:hypothetical protein DNHGIG_27230 [Collibacillus ludicampi]|uniref:DUF2512 family protein n=1 Tax=Collibacillus ludicampi TaxID=2771369 RepID=A0AAV4LH98_9BACL|nr:DUF2512 family protein [Collibacillus ludicampi]GIM47174.1 hypothetical protein DNHGIG_27230 [Collibacillus ludicampi]
MQKYSFLIKLIVTIAAIWVVAFAYRPWGYMRFSHAVVLGVIVAIIGYFTDRAIVYRSNNYVATAVDFLVAFTVVCVGDWLFWGMRVSLLFAVFVGILVAAVEFFYHYQFVRETKKA